ncbi:TPA: hypothetical protein ACSP2F_000053 [Aeromonas veronii]
MKIKLSPVRADIKPLYAKVVDINTIIVNGETFNFAPLKLGETLPISALGEVSPFASDVERDINGELHFTLLLPHGQFAPHETRFPAAYDTPISIESGDLPVPPYNAEEVPA